MCGIFGVVNDKSGDAAKTVLLGLKRLEYRGYDSWGIAVQSKGNILIAKRAGKISEADDWKKLPKSSIGIGHTRWATTGAVTDINAHPHFSTDKSFALAQNGIVENYEDLKKSLSKKGYKFVTQTDTEVIVRLIEDELKKTAYLLSAVRNAFLQLEGRNTIIILAKHSGEIIAARNGSPLVIGTNPQTAEIFFSSDALSFAEMTKKLIVVDNGKIVRCSDNRVELFDIKTGSKENYKLEDIKIEKSKIDKEGYDYFMLKEIHEEPFAIRQLIKQNGLDYAKLASEIKKAKTVYAIGSGTAGVAAAQTAFYLREIAKINCISLVGADARDYYNLFSKGDLILAPSQSGETADVLEVLEYAKKKGVKIASFVNMPGSMMTRIADYKFMAQAGPEICVLSTKVFVSQIVWGYLVVKTTVGQVAEAKTNLKELAKKIESYLQSDSKQVKQLAKKLINSHDIFLMGKYQNYQIVREGMIKIIEDSYKHAQAIPAGDLKHYAITLIEEGIPVIVVMNNDKVKSDINNAINEVRARGAYVIGISPEAHENFSLHLKVPDCGETSAVMNIVPLQLLAYYLGTMLGHDVDKPRNIAKSVTVK